LKLEKISKYLFESYDDISLKFLSYLLFLKKKEKPSPLVNDKIITAKGIKTFSYIKTFELRLDISIF